MPDIYIERAEIEKCAPDKKAINLIHTRTAIHYILSGKGYFNGKLLTAGQGFVCHRNQHPEYHQDKDEPWTYLWIRIIGDQDKINDIFKELGLCVPPYIFSFDWEYKLRRYADEYFTDGVYVTGNEMHSEGLVKMILSEHLSVKTENSVISVRKKHCDEAKKYLQSNFHHNITIENVATHLCLSRAYLRNIFFQYNGISPQNYLTNLRIARAKELLQTENFSVSSIANSVGYTDVLLFSKFFKSHTGLSPSAYRKNFRESPDV